MSPWAKDGDISENDARVLCSHLQAMLCVLLLPIAAFLLRAEAAVGIIISNNNNNNHHHNNNNNNGNAVDTDKWINDKDKYWSKFRDVSVPG
ncbi:hypothetical protein Baya_11116 [Bagarius yarrelli]|uniref:Uncharacterized protein n=1 Tax=Bagarius yarrelli TaxID=175774 RepID=A0A556UZV5_BAGYA|nr:hypothetical protein Baya_11116 [Bagarius yarrelli]